MKPRKHNYSNQRGMNCGGKVKGYADGGSVSKGTKPKNDTRRSGDTMQSTSVGSTRDTLANRRKRQMEAMGLADGGRVQLPPPKKGPKPKRITGKYPPGGRRPQAR